MCLVEGVLTGRTEAGQAFPISWHWPAVAPHWQGEGVSQHRQNLPGLPGRDLHSAGESDREAK